MLVEGLFCGYLLLRLVFIPPTLRELVRFITATVCANYTAACGRDKSVRDGIVRASRRVTTDCAIDLVRVFSIRIGRVERSILTYE